MSLCLGGPPKVNSNVRQGPRPRCPVVEAARQTIVPARPIPPTTTVWFFMPAPSRAPPRSLRRILHAIHGTTLAALVPEAQLRGRNARTFGNGRLEIGSPAGCGDVSGPLCQEVASVTRHDPGMRTRAARPVVRVMQVHVPDRTASFPKVREVLLAPLDAPGPAGEREPEVRGRNKGPEGQSASR